MPFFASSSETPAGAVRPPRGTRPRGGAIGGDIATAGFLFAAVCVIVLCGRGAAFAQTIGTIWTATLTVGSSTTDTTVFGWHSSPGVFANDNLTDIDFRHDGATWTYARIDLDGSELTLEFTNAPGTDTEDLEPMVFHVGSVTFSMRTATIDAAQRIFEWPSSGLSWSAGDTLVLKLIGTVTTPDPNPDDRLPGPPANLEVRSRGPTRNDLTWDPPRSDGGSAITGYRIEVRHTGSLIWLELEGDTGSSRTAWSHTGIADASRLDSYRVAAINLHGVGGPSQAAEVPDAVPALPLPGVLALAALLAAAGRARLGRRRRLR